MENSKLLVPVVLSIMNNYKAQAAQALAELKEVEHSLALSTVTGELATEHTHDVLLKKAQFLKSDLAEKEALVQGFSDIYETRKWSCFNLASRDVTLH